MPQSESIGNLAKAIAAAQAELKPVKKECKNPFFNSRYADLAAVWEALKPFHSHGIAITQQPFDAGEGMVGIATQLTHESGEWISGNLALPVSKDDAQGVGSAITYCRRYSLGCMTGVVTEEDDDGNHASQAKPAPAQRYQQNKAKIATAFQEIRQDIKTITDPPFNPEVCPPADGIDDVTWQEFQVYVGDDPERTKVGKAVKKKMNIELMSAVPTHKRKPIMLSIQDEARRQGVPFSEWVKE